jgi:hypothetical protein
VFGCRSVSCTFESAQVAGNFVIQAVARDLALRVLVHDALLVAGIGCDLCATGTHDSVSDTGDNAGDFLICMWVPWFLVKPTHVGQLPQPT